MEHGDCDTMHIDQLTLLYDGGDAMSSDKYRNVTGDRIRALRARMNISAESFGRRCNISTGYLLRIEEGRYPVTEELFTSILEEFGTPDPGMLRSWLTGETDDLHINGMPLVNQEESAVGRLMQVFQESGLSQREFCKLVGASNSSLSCIFSGKQKFTVNFALKIESKFHVGTDWLLYGDKAAKEYPLSREMMNFLKGNPELRKKIWQMMDEVGKD